jgi:hypothetical protein
MCDLGRKLFVYHDSPNTRDHQEESSDVALNN